MNSVLTKSNFYIKHILSSNWMPAIYVSEDNKYIKFIIEDTDNIYFEKNDKIVYIIKDNNKNVSYNTVVYDVDYPTYDKIALTLEKPLERRIESRYNINLLCAYKTKDIEEHCIAVDISHSGFKILSDKKCELKDSIELSITITDSEIINCKCKVIYRLSNKEYDKKYKYIIGLKISEITEPNKDLLKEFISTLK